MFTLLSTPMLEIAQSTWKRRLLSSLCDVIQLGFESERALGGQSSFGEFLDNARRFPQLDSLTPYTSGMSTNEVRFRHEVSRLLDNLASLDIAADYPSSELWLCIAEYCINCPELFPSDDTAMILQDWYNYLCGYLDIDAVRTWASVVEAGLSSGKTRQLISAAFGRDSWSNRPIHLDSDEESTPIRVARVQLTNTVLSHIIDTPTIDQLRCLGEAISSGILSPDSYGRNVGFFARAVLEHQDGIIAMDLVTSLTKYQATVRNLHPVRLDAIFLVLLSFEYLSDSSTGRAWRDASDLLTLC